MTPLQEAIYKTAHDFKGGARALAMRINAHPGTFNNKVDPSMPSHVININEALAVMLVAHDYRILEVLAHETGHALYQLPAVEFPADMDMLSAWADWQNEIAETVRALRSSIDDNKITQAELRTVKKELIEDLQKGLAMLAVMEGMAEPEDKVTPIKRAK